MFRNMMLVTMAVATLTANSLMTAQAHQTAPSSAETQLNHMKEQRAKWDQLLSKNDLIEQAVNEDVKEVKQHPDLWSEMKTGLLFEQATDAKFSMPKLGIPNYPGVWMHRQNERCAAITHYRVKEGLLPSRKALAEEDRCSEFAARIWYNEWKVSRK